MNKQINFRRWYGRLLKVNTSRGEYGLKYPMGACCYRDIIRDPEVKAALKKAWDRIINKREIE